MSASLCKAGRAFAEAPGSAGWRTFEVTASVEVLKPSGSTRVWLPAALLGETPFQKTFTNDFKAEGGTAKLIESKTDRLGIVAAEFPAGVRPLVTLTSRIETKDYIVDLSRPNEAIRDNPAELEYFLRPTKLIPTDGLVRVTAKEITAGSKTDRRRWLPEP